MASKFSEQLRRAIEQSELSRYAIGKATGIDQGQLSRFATGKGGMSVEAIDLVCELLRLKLVAPERKAGKAVKRKPRAK
jgi:transcriptional regulator with XRE-family HTH domain